MSKCLCVWCLYLGALVRLKQRREWIDALFCRQKEGEEEEEEEEREKKRQ